MAELVQVSELPPRHTGKLWSVSWSPLRRNGCHMLASSGESATVVWQSDVDLKKWSTHTIFGKSRSCEWNSQGDILAIGDRNISLQKLKNDNTFEKVIEFGIPSGHWIKDLSWNEKNELLCTTNNGVLYLITNKTGSYNLKHLVSIPEDAPIQRCRWHPSGTSFAISGYRSIRIYELKESESHNSKEVMETCTIDSQCEENCHHGFAAGISFSSNGDLICGGCDGTVIIWEYVTEKQTQNKNTEYVMALKNHDTFVLCVDCSRCQSENMGNLIASGCNGRNISVCSHFQKNEDNSVDEKSYDIFAEKLNAHNGGISDLKWHFMEQRILASAGLDGTIKVWELQGNITYKRKGNIDKNDPQTKKRTKGH